MHAVEMDIDWLPDWFHSREMTAAEISKDKGNSSIPHLIINCIDHIPDWLPVPTPDITHPRLSNIERESLWDGLVEWKTKIIM